MIEQAIPVSILLPADRQPPPFRIRENRILLEVMRQAGQCSTTAAYWLAFIDGYLASAPENPWWQSLKCLLLDWQAETADAEVSTAGCLEYLYESLADQRRERRFGNGLLLSTIHSVKGMEFNHVFILDGGWSGQNKEEQRRLLYVAMTRTRETLCLLQRDDLDNPFLREISGDFTLSRQTEPERCAGGKPMQKRYAILGMQDFYLSYAARFPPNAPIHRALDKTATGSKVSLLAEGGNIAVLQDNVIIARLSQHAVTAWRDHFSGIESATVIAMVRRYRDDADESYRQQCRADQWEIPLLELVYLS